MAYWKKLLIGALIYLILGVILVYVIPAAFVIYVAAIAAIIAGIYMGRGTTSMKGAIHGLLAGLLGGVIAGLIGGFVPGIGVPLGGWLNSLVVGVLEPALQNPWYALPSMSLVGIVFGAVGGFLGAKMRR